MFGSMASISFGHFILEKKEVIFDISVFGRNFGIQVPKAIVSIYSESLFSGGLAMTVTGKNLDSVSSPALLLYNTQPSLTGLDMLKWVSQ